MLETTVLILKAVSWTAITFVLGLVIWVTMRERFGKSRTPPSTFISTSAPTISPKAQWKMPGWLKKENLWKNWLAFPVIGMLVVFVLAEIVHYFVPEKIIILGAPLRPWLLVFFGLCFWFFGRHEKVGQDELGVKTLFGMIIQTFGPGPTLVPIGLCKLTKLPAFQFSIQVGASETEPTLHLLDGMATPHTIEQCQEVLEVNFATPEQAKWTTDEYEEEKINAGDKSTMDKVSNRKKQYAGDPLNTRLTAKMRVTFVAQIDPNATAQFVKTVVSPERAILELNTLARAVVGRWCGKRTPAFVGRNLGLLGREILYNAEDIVGDKEATQIEITPRDWKDRQRGQVNPNPWGLDIIRTEVHSPSFPDEVKASIATVATNIAAGEAASRLADKRREILIKEGQGIADARREMLFAEAEGARKFAEICKNSPEALALATLKTQENIAKEADFIIAPDADLLGLLAKGKKVLDTMGKGGTR